VNACEEPDLRNAANTEYTGDCPAFCLLLLTLSADGSLRIPI
jgi:hypothetical protein